jgi:NAD/NADP transhydrogenase beta subunit
MSDPASFAELDGVHRTTAFLGDAIGAITLTGSAIAFGKLVRGGVKFVKTEKRTHHLAWRM